MCKHVLIIGFLFNTLRLTSLAFVISNSNARLRAARHLVAGVFGLVVLVGGSTSIFASPFTLNITGTVTSVDPLLASFFSVGNPMTSSFTYESSVSPPVVCQPERCSFEAITAYSFTIGGISRVGSSGDVRVGNRNFTSPSPTDTVDVLLTGITPGLPGFRSDREFVVSLVDTTGSALTTEFTLPTTLDLANFDQNRWFLGFSRISDGQFAFVNGVVPAPGMLWLTLVGLIAIAVCAERSRRLECLVEGLGHE